MTESHTDQLIAIQHVLSAYRSTSAHVTEEEITAAWAELDAVRRQLRTEGRVSRAWPVLHRWAAGHDVAGPALVLELRDALAHFGGTASDQEKP